MGWSTEGIEAIPLNARNISPNEFSWILTSQVGFHTEGESETAAAALSSLHATREEFLQVKNAYVKTLVIYRS